MAFGQGLRQVQKQQLKLLPQQIQLMKLLQIPTANLEERIKEEIEENPALEMGEEHDGQEDSDLSTQDSIDDYEYEPADSGAEESTMADDGPDMSDYGSVDQPEWDPEDDIPDYQTRDINYGEGEEMTPTPIKVESNLHDILVAQLAMLELDDRRRKVAEQIVGSIDGFVERL